MPKFKIVLEDNKLKSCKRTTKFIGDREKQWEMDYYITEKKNTVEILVNTKTEKEAMDFVNKSFKFDESAPAKRRGIVSYGGSFRKASSEVNEGVVS